MRVTELKGRFFFLCFRMVFDLRHTGRHVPLHVIQRWAFESRFGEQGLVFTGWLNFILITYGGALRVWNKPPCPLDEPKYMANLSVGALHLKKSQLEFEFQLSGL